MSKTPRLSKTVIILGEADVSLYGPAKRALDHVERLAIEVDTNAIGREDLRQAAINVVTAIREFSVALEGKEGGGDGDE